MVTAICLMATGTILTMTIRLFRGARVDPGALMDRLNAVHDNAVTYVDPRFDDDVWSNGLSKLHLFLEGVKRWRFDGIGAFLSRGISGF